MPGGDAVWLFPFQGIVRIGPVTTREGVTEPRRRGPTMDLTAVRPNESGREYDFLQHGRRRGPTAGHCRIDVAGEPNEIVPVNRTGCAWITAFSLVFLATRAEAEADPRRPCQSDERSDIGLPRRTAALGAAIVPGVLVHGAGHWVARQPCTARRLAAAELVGFGGIAVGGSTIVFTGASRYLMFPAITLTIGGFGLFVTSMAADLYGVSGAARYAGSPQLTRPRWETEVGLTRVANPLFDFDWLATQRLAANFDWGRVSASLDTALAGTHARYQAGVALRALGPRPDVAARDGSYFDLYVGLSEQRYATSGFITDSGEMLATGRLDLARVGPSLRGSFVELSMGLALARTRYELIGTSVPADFESALLGRFAFGTYLGRGVHRGSEAVLYYDHRHDDCAAGLKIPGLGSGNLGHFGIAGRYYWSRRWGVGAVAEAGSAYVTGISVLFRAGGKE